MPSVPLGTVPGNPSFSRRSVVGLAGAGIWLQGSAIGAAGAVQCPVVPGLSLLVGGWACDPYTPKSLPVGGFAGRPWLRSITAEQPVFTAGTSGELT